MPNKIFQKKEIDITKDWSSSQKPLVSVICLTFNHAAYIAQCLESILSQETNFPFEIIVHDDASCDNTAEIVKNFQINYPKIVKPIFEKENQYSKHDGSLRKIIDEHLSGKYVAFCEGDDYWCNIHKLQTATDFLEKNTDYVACAHNTLCTPLSRYKRNFVFYSMNDCDLSLQEILQNGGFHLSSLVCRKEFRINRPSFCFAQRGVGDYPFAIFLFLSGKIRRFGEIKSVYRYGVPGSWQLRVGQKNSTRIKNIQNVIKMLSMANEWSNNKYQDIFHNAINISNYRILLLEGNFQKAKQTFPNFWASETFFSKLKKYIRFYLRKKC